MPGNITSALKHMSTYVSSVDDIIAESTEDNVVARTSVNSVIACEYEDAKVSPVSSARRHPLGSAAYLPLSG